MNDAIKRRNAAKRCISSTKRAQIALAEAERRIALLRLGDHAAGKVDPRNLSAAGGKKSGHVTRAAAKVGHWAKRANLLGKRLEQGAVEWLGRQLIGDMGSVVGGHAIVACRK